jgi:serine/threonine-protein kinase
MAFAARQGSFGGIFGGDRNKGQLVDSSKGTCTVATGALNVRSGPGVNNAVVNTVEQGRSLSLTGTGKNGWVEISSPVKGWVYNDKKYIDCDSTNQPPVEAKATPTPVEIPKPKKAPVASKPKPPVDNGSDTLAKADEKYQNGDIEGAIAQAKDLIASGSASAKDAQAKITQWQQEWTDAKTKYDRVQKALDEGRWDEVIRATADPKLLQQTYWRDKVSQLIEEAKKRKAEAEASIEQPTAPPEQPQPEKPKSKPTESVKPSPAATPASPREVPASP